MDSTYHGLAVLVSELRVNLRPHESMTGLQTSGGLGAGSSRVKPGQARSSRVKPGQATNHQRRIPGCVTYQGHPQLRHGSTQPPQPNRGLHWEFPELLCSLGTIQPGLHRVKRRLSQAANQVVLTEAQPMTHGLDTIGS